MGGSTCRLFALDNILGSLLVGLVAACFPVTACAQSKDTADSPAAVTKWVARSASAYPKLVLQRTIAAQSVFAWSQDDRFVIGIDNLARSVTVWDAATGNIVNFIPFPAFDPKSNIQAWDATVDVSDNLTVLANIRDTDSVPRQHLWP
jgi:hypothetical protein